jgi:hypothetical protein
MNSFLNENNISKAQNLVDMLGGDNTQVIRVKNDKGLIERTEANKKVILVEDNRQVICD